MTAIPQSTARQVSDRILEPLRQVAGRQGVMLVLCGLLQAFIVGMACWLAVSLILGYFPLTPVVLKVILSFLAWVATLGSAFIFLRPAFKRRSISVSAAQVEAALPEVQERISSAVELSGETNPLFAGSPELIEHLIRQAEIDAQNVDPQFIISSKHVMRWAMYSSPLVILWLLLAAFNSEHVLGGLYRGLVPLSNTLPNSLATIIVQPGNAAVPQGDSLDITAEIPAGAFDGRIRHAWVAATYTAGQKTAADMDALVDNSQANAPQRFHVFIDNVQQDFTYQVQTDHGESPLFKVTMQQRPAIAGIDVHYIFPAYTKLGERDETGKDGMIEAVAGTRARVTVHANQPLADKSQLVLSENSPNQLNFPLASIGGTDYQATFKIERTTQYKVELVNPLGLNNKDDQSRIINARPDEIPKIAIASPAHVLTVRPDDTIPIKFQATDDFGISKIQAVVQIDDKAPETFDIKVPDGQPAELTGEWPLSIPYQLSRKFVTSARTIEYQLKVFDNRDPDPQMGQCAKQTLIIDAGAESLAAREEQAALKSLSEAIKKALETLNQAENPVRQLDGIDPSRAMTAQEVQSSNALKDQLSKCGKDLADAGAQNLSGPFGEIAAAAQTIADQPIRASADDLAKAGLNADQPAPRKIATTDALVQIAAAKTQLEDLLKKLEQEAHQQEVERTVADLAKTQREIADDMVEKADPAEIAKEQKIQQQLESAIAKYPEFQTPVAEQTANQFNQLTRKIDDLKTQESKTEAAMQAAQNAQAAKGDMADIKKQQAQLNRDIKGWEQKDQNAIKTANAPTPKPAQLESINQNLEDQKLLPAEEGQKHVADDLAAAQQKLNDQADQNNPQNAPQAAQAQQHENQAQNLEKQAQQLNQEIQRAMQAGNNPTRPSAPANRDAAKLAQQVANQAQKMEAQAAPPERKQLEAAKQEAQEAKAQANQGDAQKAQQKLADAAHQLEQAAEQEQPQAPKPQAPMQEAADQAKDLAQRQQDLADQTDAAQKALAEAQQEQNQIAQAPQQEQQEAQQSQQAAQEAQQMAQQTQQSAPQVAQRAQQTQQAMQQAAQHEQQAAQQMQKGNLADAQKEEQQAQEQMNKAEDAARDLPEDQQLAKAEDPKNQNGEPEDPQANPPEANPENQQHPEAGEHPHEGEHHPEEAGEHPHEGEHPEEGHPEAAHPEEAGEHPENGPPHAGNEPPGQPHAEPPGPPHAGNEPPHAGGEEAPHPGSEPGSEPGSHPGQGQQKGPPSPQQQQALMAQAAQQVQEAHAAMAEATQGQPEAALQGAHDLENAALALAQAMPESPDNSPPDNEPVSDEPPHPGQGKNSGKPGPSANSHQGLQIAQFKAADKRPQSVQELGISASDWAHLPPLMQQELQNAAQQSGPPAYREMIKNYYVKIARISADDATEAH